MTRPIKDIFLEWLDQGWAMPLIVSMSIGLAFGLGYWVAQFAVTQQQQSEANERVSFDNINRRANRLEHVQKTRLSYYDELLKPGRSGAAAPVAVAQKPQEKPAPVQEPEEDTSLKDQGKEPAAPKVAPSQNKIAQQLANVLGDETPKSVKEQINTPIPTSTGSAFAVQVASLPNREAAESVAQKFRAKGYEVRLVQGEVAGRGTMYRVRIGGFANRESANKQRDLLAQRESIQALVVAQ